MLIEDAKILITDDSILARKQLKDMISTVGTPVFYEARDGQDAINQYKRNNQEPRRNPQPGLPGEDSQGLGAAQHVTQAGRRRLHSHTQEA